jgi:hypothetical protein
MDNLPKIQVVYNYYCNNRITPIFIGNEDTMADDIPRSRDDKAKKTK